MALLKDGVGHIWASKQENLSSGVCEQQRRRPAPASVQSDQPLCYSNLTICRLATDKMLFLASLCSWGDCFKTCFFGNPEDRFFFAKAVIYLINQIVH